MPDTSSFSRDAMRVRSDTIAKGERFLFRETAGSSGELMEALVIEWSPSRRYVCLIIDPSFHPRMKWFDLDKTPLICWEKLPQKVWTKSASVPVKGITYMTPVSRK